VRRATSLQLTPDANLPMASVSPAVFERIGLGGDRQLRVTGQGGSSVTLPVRIDKSLPDHVVRVPAGHPSTALLGPMFGSLRIEKA
jgi:NADH-quinone oxidoreductase subunit G